MYILIVLIIMYDIYNQLRLLECERLLEDNIINVSFYVWFYVFFAAFRLDRLLVYYFLI